MERTDDEILNDAIDQLIGGVSMQHLLTAEPDNAAWLAPALRDAQALLRSRPPATPVAAARDAAAERMQASLTAARAKADEFKPTTGAATGVALAATTHPASRPIEWRAWLSSFIRRPASFRAAAIAGSIALVGVMGVGAVAATGNAPEPVRELFGSSGSALRVEFEGIIVSINADTTTLDVDVAGDIRVVRVVGTTELSRGGDAIAFEQFAVGDPVEVKGALQLDDTIVASRVHLEDDIDAAPDNTPTIDDDGPAATPTIDDDDQDDNRGNDVDDNSGPGNADDNDRDADDNSGRGNGDDDDGDADDNSGPGNVDGDDGDVGDNSGPGNGDDDDGDADDDSGTGNGDNDDGDADDNSGTGNGDNDDGDANDNSGTGNGDNDDGGADDNSGPGSGDNHGANGDALGEDDDD